MIVVADSSPLIILAKLGCFDFLERIYSRVYISPEVHKEVVNSGAGRPGAQEVTRSSWIEVKTLQNQTAFLLAQRTYSLGLGELSTILLGKEMHADEFLFDDQHARKLARSEGCEVRGSVSLLEIFFERGWLSDLRAVFRQLLIHNIYIERRLLNRRLQVFNLPPI